jgi:hypothetical protein
MTATAQSIPAKTSGGRPYTSRAVNFLDMRCCFSMQGSVLGVRCLVFGVHLRVLAPRQRKISAPETPKTEDET